MPNQAIAILIVLMAVGSLQRPSEKETCINMPTSPAMVIVDDEASKNVRTTSDGVSYIADSRQGILIGRSPDGSELQLDLRQLDCKN